MRYHFRVTDGTEHIYIKFLYIYSQIFNDKNLGVQYKCYVLCVPSVPTPEKPNKIKGFSGNSSRSLSVPMCSVIFSKNPEKPSKIKGFSYYGSLLLSVPFHLLKLYQKTIFLYFLRHKPVDGTIQRHVFRRHMIASCHVDAPVRAYAHVFLSLQSVSSVPLLLYKYPALFAVYTFRYGFKP